MYLDYHLKSIFLQGEGDSIQAKKVFKKYTFLNTFFPEAVISGQ